MHGNASLYVRIPPSPVTRKCVIFMLVKTEWVISTQELGSSNSNTFIADSTWSFQWSEWTFLPSMCSVSVKSWGPFSVCWTKEIFEIRSIHPHGTTPSLSLTQPSQFHTYEPTPLLNRKREHSQLMQCSTCQNVISCNQQWIPKETTLKLTVSRCHIFRLWDPVENAVLLPHRWLDPGEFGGQEFLVFVDFNS